MEEGLACVATGFLYIGRDCVSMQIGLWGVVRMGAPGEPGQDMSAGYLGIRATRIRTTVLC